MNENSQPKERENLFIRLLCIYYAKSLLDKDVYDCAKKGREEECYREIRAFIKRLDFFFTPVHFLPLLCAT